MFSEEEVILLLGGVVRTECNSKVVLQKGDLRLGHDMLTKDDPNSPDNTEVLCKT